MLSLLKHTAQRGLDVGRRFGICLSKAVEKNTHGMKYSLALQKDKSSGRKNTCPAFVCPVSWNSERRCGWVRSLGFVCHPKPKRKYWKDHWKYWKVSLSGSSLAVGLCVRNSGFVNIPPHPLQKNNKKPTQQCPLTQRKITSADKRQQKIRECFSLILKSW